MATAARIHAIEAGTILADSYEVTHLLGKGGMGSVWAARHLRLLGKQVAIKVLHTEVAADTESVARFHREAQIASRLGHPNIIQVIDINHLPDGTPYLVLEYLQGESLADRLARGPMPNEHTFAIVRQVGSALAAAHAEDIIHRDLKPQNIFLCPTETGGYATEVAKVLDFGISKVRNSTTVKTQTTSMLGTPQYMAPEQATGHHDRVDGRTDVFALGVMVYEMISGKEAFKGNSIPEVVFKVVYEEPVPLATLVPSIDPKTAAAVHRAMAKQQEQRFRDVSAFVEALTGDPLTTLRSGATASAVMSRPLPLSVDTSVPRRSHEQQAFAPTVTPGEALPAVPVSAVMAGITPSGLHAGVRSFGPGADELATMDTLLPGQHAVLTAPGMSQSLPGSVARAAEHDGSAGKPGSQTRGRSRGAILAIGLVAAAGAAVLTFALVKKLGTSDSTAKPVGTASSDAGLVVAVAVAADAGAPPPDHVHVEATGSAGQDVGSRVVDAGGPADTQAATTTAGKEKTDTTGKKTEPGKPDEGDDEASEALSGEAKKLLDKAVESLKNKNPDEAIRLARQAQGLQKSARAFATLAKAYCMKRDLGNAKAQARNVRGRQRKRLIDYCDRFDTDLRD